MIDINLKQEDGRKKPNFQGVSIHKLDRVNATELQYFLDLFDDFFILCEGVEASVEGVLSACPPLKEINRDKFCLGAYKSGQLIAFIDFIKDYPVDKTLTLGYLLVHPSYQSDGLGTILVNAISDWAVDQRFRILRVAVQRQNPRALNFWLKNNFKITSTIEEKLGNKHNLTDVLELTL